jgi:hypothetical protein
LKLALVVALIKVSKQSNPQSCWTSHFSSRFQFVGYWSTFQIAQKYAYLISHSFVLLLAIFQNIVNSIFNMKKQGPGPFTWCLQTATEVGRKARIDFILELRRLQMLKPQVQTRYWGYNTHRLGFYHHVAVVMVVTSSLESPLWLTVLCLLSFLYIAANVFSDNHRSLVNDPLRAAAEYGLHWQRAFFTLPVIAPFASVPPLSGFIAVPGSLPHRPVQPQNPHPMLFPASTWVFCWTILIIFQIWAWVHVLSKSFSAHPDYLRQSLLLNSMCHNP